MPDLLTEAAEAIRAVQQEVRWKPGSAIRHLQKRKRRGHLPDHTTISDYDRLIRSIVFSPNASVYSYHYEDTKFIAIIATVQTQDWLVMFGLDGLLESAFVLERPALYLDKPVFERLGTVKDVLT